MSSPSDPTPSSSAAAAAAAVTVASTPHPQTLTLALPIQTTTNPNPNPNSDSWSESATSTLIDAWGELYLQLSRGPLKQQHWQQISSLLSKSDAQCKNRIDSLKKKYKSEKSKISSGQSPLSTWPYFHRLDILIGPTLLKSLPPHPFPQKTRTRTTTISNPNKKPSLSPEPASARVNGDGGGGEIGELSRAVARFGEVYERVEKAKASWAVEMERARMGFVRELEMKRMEFFVKTQMELSSVSVSVDGNEKEMVVMPRRKKRNRRQD